MISIKVTRMPGGYHWRAMLPNGEPLTRLGKPVQAAALLADAWEASTEGHSSIAAYDPKNSYVVEEIVTYFGKKKK